MSERAQPSAAARSSGKRPRTVEWIGGCVDTCFCHVLVKSRFEKKGRALSFSFSRPQRDTLRERLKSRRRRRQRAAVALRGANSWLTENDA